MDPALAAVIAARVGPRPAGAVGAAAGGILALEVPTLADGAQEHQGVALGATANTARVEDPRLESQQRDQLLEGHQRPPLAEGEAREFAEALLVRDGAAHAADDPPDPFLHPHSAPKLGHSREAAVVQGRCALVNQHRLLPHLLPEEPNKQRQPQDDCGQHPSRSQAEAAPPTQHQEAQRPILPHGDIAGHAHDHLERVHQHALDGNDVFVQVLHAEDTAREDLELGPGEAERIPLVVLVARRLQPQAQVHLACIRAVLLAVHDRLSHVEESLDGPAVSLHHAGRRLGRIATRNGHSAEESFQAAMLPGRRLAAGPIAVAAVGLGHLPLAQGHDGSTSRQARRRRAGERVPTLLLDRRDEALAGCPQGCCCRRHRAAVARRRCHLTTPAVEGTGVQEAFLLSRRLGRGVCDALPPHRVVVPRGHV
mmetsp:Transcript_43428/g.126497  ORF Transcript_43428/g.126497 Transcript_43428/m.126497 type:complete len:425 (-) Transcript_43428:308-1582(-)